jgi:hypothetical protein
MMRKDVIALKRKSIKKTGITASILNVVNIISKRKECPHSRTFSRECFPYGSILFIWVLFLSKGFLDKMILIGEVPF